MIRSPSLLTVSGLLAVAVAVSLVLLQYGFPQIFSAKKHESPSENSPDEAVPYQEEQPRRPAFLY